MYFNSDLGTCFFFLIIDVTHQKCLQFSNGFPDSVVVVPQIVLINYCKVII